MSSRHPRPSHKLEIPYILNRENPLRHDPMDVDTSPASSSDSGRRPATPGLDSGREYVCKSCSFAFRSKGDLSKHDRTVHQGIKKHPCPQCGKRFAEKGNLTKHMKRHEGIREHPCTYPNCKATFVLKDGLKRHLKSVHVKEESNNSSKPSASDSSDMYRQNSYYHSSSRLRK